MTTRPTLQAIRERLTVALIVLLPLHALLVTVATRLIAGPGHAPLTALALWKEALLAGIVTLAAVEIWQMWRRGQRPTCDLLDLLIVGFFALAVASAAWHGTPTPKLLLGLRYDVLAPLAFVVLRHAPWSDQARSRLLAALLWVGGAVAAVGLAGLVLPTSIFGALGYATDFHSLYLPDSPLAPFSQIGGTAIRRAQSTLSGPNQLGLWLLVPIGALLASAGQLGRTRTLALGTLLIATLAATFSRTAWIGAVAGTLTVAALQVGPRMARRWLMPVAGLLATAVLVGILAAPATIVRLSSSRGHFERPLEALHRVVQAPWGEGLASAGPASSRFADACVMLQPEDDPRWAEAQPELCVFLGDKQVQPQDRLCRCPFHPENWYLQIAVELGWPGFSLWIGILTFALWRLWPLARARHPLGTAAAVALLGTTIGALFLHAWEDTAVAFSVWMLCAIALQKGQNSVDTGSTSASNQL